MSTSLAPSPLPLPQREPDLPGTKPAVNDEAKPRGPAILIAESEISNPAPQRLVILELFGEMKNDFAKRKSYRPLAHVAVEATSLHSLETRSIGENIARLNRAAGKAEDLTTERMLNVQVMRANGHWGRRQTFVPEWRESFAFTPERPLNGANVTASLNEAVVRNHKPGMH